MFLFYVLSFFKKGDTIQGGIFFKGGHYLRKYGICNNCHVFYLITAFCGDDVTCNGHGTCRADGTCECDSQFFSADCASKYLIKTSFVIELEIDNSLLTFIRIL